MTTQCIVVADGARARILIATSPEDPDSEGGPRLVEHQDLVNTEAKVPDRELFAGTEPGRSRSSGAGTGSAHGLDDGRRKHREETARRFAKDVARAVGQTVSTRFADRLVVVAEPKFLGLLRPALRGRTPAHVELVELGEDLSWHSLPRIRRVLTQRGVLAARTVPPAAFRARGQAAPARPKGKAAAIRPAARRG